MQQNHIYSARVRINDTNSEYFLVGKGVRQGDPASPLLFNIVADVFTRILVKAADNNYISGIFAPNTHAGVISMQYADDTLLFLDNNLENAKHLKWLLSCLSRCQG